jgi:NTP pyrophosphatase (non-canonical NTP hydrolase)
MENILKKAMQLFNWNDQLAQLMEECAELTVLCNHIRRGRSKPLENKKDAEDLASEIADVQIMIEQLTLYYPALQEEISSKRKEKLERLSNKIKNHQ